MYGEITIHWTTKRNGNWSWKLRVSEKCVVNFVYNNNNNYIDLFLDMVLAAYACNKHKATNIEQLHVSIDCN